MARGALAGMAESVFLKDGHTGDETATILFDCSKEAYGVETLVKTFGVPNYPGDHYTRSDGSDAILLNAEVRLHNGKFKTFEFDVTDQLLGQPRGVSSWWTESRFRTRKAPKAVELSTRRWTSGAII